jgi:hypothetical protein
MEIIIEPGIHFGARLVAAMKTSKPSDTIIVRNELGRSLAEAMAWGLELVNPLIEVRDESQPDAQAHERK